MKKNQLTKEGYEKIKQEYDELKTKKRQQAIDRLQRARAMGDLSENSEYHSAKEELALVEGRIRELEEILSTTEVIEQKTAGREVQLGSQVVLETDSEKDEFTIVGEFEADPIHKKLSQTSPVGKALMGKEVGEIVEVESPAGKISYKIIEIK